MGRLLNDCDASYFDKINAEVNELSGEEVNYYAMNAVAGKVDPLYGEHTERSPDGPYKVWGSISWPQMSVNTTESGIGVDFDGMITVSRSHLDQRNIPYPSEGDIMEFWRTPYHDVNSRGKGLFFDIIKAEGDGYVNDSPIFTQFKIYLKRRSQYGAERRIEQT
jgi:hypothetical protein